MAPRHSVHSRLLSLDAVFTLEELRATGLKERSERNALSRWSDEKMVARAGLRLGIYYNLLRDRRGSDAHLGDVAIRVHGRAVIVGGCAFHDSGWTTQIPRVLTIAVPDRRSIPQIHGVAAYRRPEEWFDAVAEDLKTSGRGRFGLPTLSPPMALADALLHRDTLHHLTPDDIEIPDEVGSTPVVDACTWMGVDEDAYLPFLQASGLQEDLPFAHAAAHHGMAGPRGR